VGIEPWNPEWATARTAEARRRESICLRRDGLSHTYPLHQQDFETMHAYYAELGEIPPSNRFCGWRWRDLSRR
jgi:hypothetical protein